MSIARYSASAHIEPLEGRVIGYVRDPLKCRPGRMASKVADVPINGHWRTFSAGARAVGGARHAVGASSRRRVLVIGGRVY